MDMYKGMSLEKRKKHSESIMRENPSRVPILVTSISKGI